MQRSKPTTSRRPTAEALERRALLAIDTAVAQTYLDGNTDLVVQSAAAASDRRGTSVVVYSDRDGMTSLGNDVFVRRFDSAEQPLSAPALVNVTTADAQMNADVAMNDAGQFVVVWQSRNQDGGSWGVYARAYGADGIATTGEILVNQTTAGAQIQPRVAIGADGRFVVAWVNADTGNGEIYGRRFNANGSAIAGEFKASGTTADGYSVPDVAIASDNGFAIVWTRTLRSGDNSADVQMQVYNASGVGVGSTILVHLETAADQAEPAIVAAGSRFIVAWSDNSSGSAQILYRAFNGSATPLTSPEQASQDSDGNRSRPRVTGDSSGNFTVAWTRQEVGAFYSGVDLRSFDSTFTPTSNETSISDGTSARTLFDLVQTGQGTFRDVSTIGEFVGYGVPVTSSLRNVIGLDGTNGADNVVAYDLDASTVRTSINGQQRDYPRNAFAGLLASLGGGNDGFFGSDLSLNATILGGAGNDSIYAGSGNDRIDGEDGDDLIEAGAGNDTVEGGAGRDRLFGQGGNDSIGGGDDADYIDAGDGNDYAIGDGGDDTMYGGDGGDTITGGAGKNRIYGGEGNDRLNGGGGRDYIFGEGGDDRLYGNGGTDDLDGGGNVDKLYGGDGDDFLVGGSSNDRLFGQAGNDTLSGGKGNDYLDGDIGTDTVWGREPGDTLINIEIIA